MTRTMADILASVLLYMWRSQSKCLCLCMELLIVLCNYFSDGIKKFVTDTP